MGISVIHDVPASRFSPRRRWAHDKAKVSVGERDVMSIKAREFGLPLCGRYVGPAMGCTRAAGHDEARDTPHTHASPTGIVLAVFRP